MTFRRCWGCSLSTFLALTFTSGFVSIFSCSGFHISGVAVSRQVIQVHLFEFAQNCPLGLGHSFTVRSFSRDVEIPYLFCMSHSIWALRLLSIHLGPRFFSHSSISAFHICSSEAFVLAAGFDFWLAPDVDFDTFFQTGFGASPRLPRAGAVPAPSLRAADMF